MLTVKDHERLREAAELVHDVMNAHTVDMVGPALVAFGQAFIDLRIAERYMESSGVNEGQ